MEMIISVTGTALTAKKLERAISLSHEKYCSATAMLARTRGTAGQLWNLSDGGHFENMGGYELIRRVRDLGKETPAIAVTAFARPADRQRAIAAGYAAYCPKPVDTDYFLRTVATVVQRH